MITDIIKNKNLKKHEKLSLILKNIVTQCGIDQTKYFILGSYAVREHREINDLDIHMDRDEFIKLHKTKTGQLEFYNDQIRWFLDMTDEYKKYADENAKDFSIEIFQKKPDEGFPNNTFSLTNLEKNNGLDRDSNGNQFFNLNTLLRWKETMNREKDKPDIVLLKKLLGKTGGYYGKYIKYKNKYIEAKKYS